MSKTTVLELVQALSGGRADPYTCDRFYDECILDLSQTRMLIAASIVTAGPDEEGTPDSSYVLPDDAIDALQYFYDDRMLPVAQDLEALAWDRNWRGLKGTPFVVKLTEVGARRFRLIPLPGQATKTYSFIFGDPFDTEYPEYGVVVFHTEKRTDVPDWLELALAHMVIAREFSRESNHQDVPFSARASKIAVALLGMVQ